MKYFHAKNVWSPLVGLRPVKHTKHFLVDYQPPIHQTQSIMSVPNPPIIVRRQDQGTGNIIPKTHKESLYEFLIILITSPEQQSYRRELCTVFVKSIIHSSAISGLHWAPTVKKNTHVKLLICKYLCNQPLIGSSALGSELKKMIILHPGYTGF